MKQPLHKICPQCKKEFLTFDTKKVYCNTACEEDAKGPEPFDALPRGRPKGMLPPDALEIMAPSKCELVKIRKPYIPIPADPKLREVKIPKGEKIMWKKKCVDCGKDFESEGQKVQYCPECKKRKTAEAQKRYMFKKHNQESTVPPMGDDAYLINELTKKLHMAQAQKEKLDKRIEAYTLVLKELKNVAAEEA